VFGLLHLIGIKYRPQLANLPDQRLWRFDGNAGYGPLSQAARGRIDTAKIAAHWEERQPPTAARPGQPQRLIRGSSPAATRLNASETVAPHAGACGRRCSGWLRMDDLRRV
jgi:hypothetical protein